jgi:NADH:ubiquinone oxidoreductase subunit 3 (subunit A)
VARTIYFNLPQDLMIISNTNLSSKVVYFSDCLKYSELHSLLITTAFIVVFLTFIYVFFFLISGRFFKSIFELKEMPYECGFYSYSIELHNTAVLYYFKALMLFLIFDLEAVYFIPLLFISKGLILMGLYFIYIPTILFFLFLVFGLLCEFILNQ